MKNFNDTMERLNVSSFRLKNRKATAKSDRDNYRTFYTQNETKDGYLMSVQSMKYDHRLFDFEFFNKNGNCRFDIIEKYRSTPELDINDEQQVNNLTNEILETFHMLLI